MEVGGCCVRDYDRHKRNQTVTAILPKLMFTFVFSAFCCGVYLRFARRWQIVDVPNERSSHNRPTPKGGGLPIMLAFFVGVALVSGAPVFYLSQYSAVLTGALFLTVLGVVDDISILSVRLRFLAYAVCCLLVSAALLHGVLLVLCATLAMLWALNLYNFMDGVDGLAATQCFLACCGAALLASTGNGSGEYAVICLLLGFSHLGFLIWNWPVARLFMGDAGSIPTGFLMAALAVLGAARGDLAFACWAVLLAAFITDASWTLLWRVFTGQKFTQAHRAHAYQRLSRHWGSHLPVVMLLIAINGIWLFPMAWATLLWPQYAIILVILAYLPLLFGMAKIRNFA